MSSGTLPQCKLWGDIDWNPCGQSSLRGGMLRLHGKLDSFFAEWGENIGAEEHLFPTFIDAVELKKAGYFKAFPHLMTVPVSLARDDDTISDFVRSEAPDNAGNLALPATSPVGQVLTPAACYHFYIALQGKRLTSARVMTTCCRCFRREDFYEPLKRQWNFSMREFVCIGTRKEVEKHLDDSRRRIVRFCSQIGLPVRFEEATDPFFKPLTNAKFLMQKLAPIKTELMYKDLAIASLNMHHDHFGQSFNIQRGDGTANSACVAFGMERWLFALADHFGDDILRVAERFSVPQLDCMA